MNRYCEGKSNTGTGGSAAVCEAPSDPADRHPLGTRARVLFSSVFGPFACDDEFGSRRINPMELFHNQITRVQGPFSLRFFNRSWGLMFIQANISAPCRLLDFPSLERFEHELKTESYDIIGISSILSNIGKVKKMCELIRKYQPQAAIVIGGHVTNYDGLRQYVDADHIVRGEGVRWFRRYLGEDEGQPLRHIACYSSFGFRVLGNDLPEEVEKGSAVLIPSVGCPVGCNFCSTSAMFGGKGRFVNFFKTGDELFEILCRLEETLGTREFFVSDENFLLDRPRAMRLLELIETHDKDWGFGIFSSANALRKYSMYDLVRLGVSRVWIGLEGENSRYQKLHGTDTKTLVRELQSHGICVVGSNIIGLENHTPENIDQVIDYAVSHKADFNQFMLYTPLPGTPLYRELNDAGKILSEDELPLADRHGQYRFAHRHPHIAPGQETDFLLRSFQRDYETHGPAILRGIRTALSGWKRYRNDPQPRIRRRHARKAKTMATVQAGCLWAGRKWFKDNPRVVEDIDAILSDIYSETGLMSRAAAQVYGRVIFSRLRREDRQLKSGWTKEPPTFYETNVGPIPSPGMPGDRTGRAQWLRTKMTAEANQPETD